MYPTKLNDVAKAVGVPGLAGYGTDALQQGNNAGAQRQPEVAAALQNAEIELKNLFEVIGGLEQRLEPVLHPIPATENEKPAQPFHSPIASHISSVANSIKTAAWALSVIHSRLEI